MTTTASIYFNKIRIDYPQAGKDNDSQGFRDNFRNIFNAFSATNADIESLQLNSVTLGGNNDFGFNTIKKASLQSCVTKIVDNSLTPASGNIYVNYLESNYQKYSLNGGNSTFYIQNWPSQGYSQITLSVKNETTASTQVNFGGNLVAVGAVQLPVITTQTSVTNFFDLWSDDGGVTVYVSQRGA